MKKILCKILLAVTILAFTCPIMANAEEKKDIYGIGSISKMYTTAAVMKLYEDGVIDLDEPITTYIPDFTMADERYRLITPRMLLNHTSGLMGTTQHDAFTFGLSDTRYHDSLLQELKTQKLKADPGAYGVYCNDGFTLAELLIERVTGMSYSEYLDKTFFEPMKIQNTFTTVHNFDETRLAACYVGTTQLPYIDCHLIGSGGIYSTASDVAKFGQLFTDNSAQRNHAILSKETLAAMAKSNSKQDEICLMEGDKQFDYGLGWDCVNTYPYSAYGLKTLTKGGSVIFQNSALVVIPEKNISASMIVSGGSGDDASYALQDILLEILEEEGIIPEKKDLSVKIQPEPKAVPLPDEMREYAGYYLSNQMLKVSFSEESTLLLDCVDDTYNTTQEYVYVGEGKFKPLSSGYLNHLGQMVTNSNGNRGTGTLHFSNEKNGKTYLCGSAYETIYELGENATTLPMAEKINEAVPTEKVLAKWNQRVGKKYFLVDSVYNSWEYYTSGIRELQSDTECPGYIHTDELYDVAKIKDENTAISDVDLPIMVGRDLKTYRFTIKEKGEELKYASLTYLSEEQIADIQELAQTVTMEKSEATKWYRINGDYANQAMQIQVPENGAYYIYDKDGACVATSITLGKDITVILPEDGFLLLAGEKGSTFEILYQGNTN